MRYTSNFTTHYFIHEHRFQYKHFSVFIIRLLYGVSILIVVEILSFYRLVLNTFIFFNLKEAYCLFIYLHLIYLLIRNVIYTLRSVSILICFIFIKRFVCNSYSLSNTSLSITNFFIQVIRFDFSIIIVKWIFHFCISFTACNELFWISLCRPYIWWISCLWQVLWDIMQ